VLDTLRGRGNETLIPATYIFPGYHINGLLLLLSQSLGFFIAQVYEFV
jgi:hypothetical protein